MKPSLKHLDRRDLATGALVGIVVACLTGLGQFGAGMGAFAAFVAATGHQVHRGALQKRIDHPIALVWDVIVNDVRVGQVSDASYAGLEKAVHADWQVYGAQLANLARAGLRAGEMLMVVIPVSLFWLGLAVMLFDSEAAAYIVDSILTAPASDIVRAMDGLLLLAASTIVAVTVMVALLVPLRFGYENKFASELSDAVRRHVGVPATGRMVLVSFDTPVPAAAV